MGELDEMIASMRGLEDLDKRTAQIAAEKLQQKVAATAAAGTTPAGKPWAPKKDGGRAMPNVASHITTAAYGPVVRMKLEGPDVFHHFSEKASEPQRQVIPDAGAGVPPEVQPILDAAAEQAFNEIMGGKK